MKYVVLILVFVLFSFKLLSQDIAISEKYSNEPLPLVLKQLHTKYDLKFAYDAELLHKAKVSASFENNTPVEVISALLNQSNLKYKLLNGVYVITPRKAFFRMTEKQQTFRIIGLVKANDTHETLPYANIFINGGNKGTTSNVDGYFTLMGLSGDSIELTIRYLGFKTQTFILTKNECQKLRIFHLTPSSQMLNDVIVEESIGEHSSIVRQTGHIKLNPLKIDNLPNLGETDIFRSLQLLPGISGTNETSSGLSIRGGAADHNLILFDGLHLYQLDHFFGIFSAFNSQVIKDIQVFKSGYQAKYGGRVAGVVDITGKTGNMLTPSYNFDLNLISLNLTAEIPVAKHGALLLAMRRSYTDYLKSPLYKSLMRNIKDNNQKYPYVNAGTISYYEKEIDPEFYFYDYNLKFSYRPGANDILSLSIYGGKDFLELQDEEKNMYNSVVFINENDWGTRGGSLRWGHQWNPAFYSNLNVAYSKYSSGYYANNDFNYYYDYQSEQGSSSVNEKTIEENDLNDLSLRIDNQLHINQFNKIEFGLFYIKNRIRYKSIINNIDFQNIDNTGNQISFYLQDAIKINQKAGLTLGFRGVYFDLLGRYYGEPRISMHYDLTKHLFLKASAGRYHQMVSKVVIEDFEGNHRDFWVLSNQSQIPVLASNHYVGGLAYRKNNFLVDLEFYRNNIQGLTEFVSWYADPASGEIADYNFDGTFHHGKGLSKGFDLLIQQKSGNFTGWLSYTYGNSMHTFNELNEGKDYPANHDQTHELKLVGIYSLKKWDFSACWVYGSGRPYSGPRGQYSINTISGNSITFLDVDARNAFRLPPYHRLDLSASLRFEKEKIRGKTGVSLINIYDRDNIKYRFYQSYDEFDSSNNLNKTIKVTDVKLLGFTPNVFISISF